MKCAITWLIILYPILIRNEIDIGMTKGGLHTNYIDHESGDTHIYIKPLRKPYFDVSALHTYKAVWTRCEESIRAFFIF